MDWSLCGRNLRHERVKQQEPSINYSKLQSFELMLGFFQSMVLIDFE